MPDTPPGPARPAATVAALTVAAALLLACALPAMADETPTGGDRGTWVSQIGTPPVAHNLVISGGGKPMMTFDLDKRTISVPDDVDTNEAARRVIEALRLYLETLCKER